MHAAVAARLTETIASAGIVLDRSGLTLFGAGADNIVFAGHTLDGRALIVKTPRRERPRYGTAAFAARALARHRVPAPEVLFHDASICVETRCPGVPLTGAEGLLDTWDSTPYPAMLRAAKEAGALLRRAHTIAVHGYGRLTPTGSGPHHTLLDSLLPHPAPPAIAAPAGGLAQAAHRAVSGHLWRLRDAGPRLLVGDCAARHIFLNPADGAISGFIDLESARGGHPLADIAGFSVREHPQMAQALLHGYFPDGVELDRAWALTLHRARIASSLLLFHTRRGENEPAHRIADCLAADLAAITSHSPTVLPAHLS
ncbi:phosphotransferase family protein [Nonomuraea solani]|nr:phosphotransferase [Nonomuraea solani]